MHIRCQEPTRIHHNLLVLKIRIALKKLRKSTRRKRWDKENLKNKIVEYANNVDSKLAQVTPILTVEPDDYWQRFKTVMKQEAEEIIGHSTGPVIKKPWITASTLEMINQRRQWKHHTTEKARQQYRKLNNKLRKVTQRAKQEWWA